MTAPAWAGSSRRARVKLAPWPTLLRAVRRPPINSASWRLIESPRPVPPWRALTPSAVWSKGVNSRTSCSRVMPGPVSATSISTAWPPVSSAQTLNRRVMEPSVVNFMALEIRLFSTCRSRIGSPRTAVGTVAAPSIRSFRPLARAGPRHSRVVWFSRSRRLKSTASTVMCPASSLAWSSRSSSSAFIMKPASLISRAWARAELSFAPRSSSAEPVRMALIGVRRSWPTAARKALRPSMMRSASARLSSASIRAAVSEIRAWFIRFQVDRQ